MALTVTQTSAAKIVRATRLTDGDVSRLVREFGLHPLDAEKLTIVPTRTIVERYRDYLVMKLIVPWPSKQGLVGLDVQLVAGPKTLIIIGDTPLRSIAKELEVMTASAHQVDSMGGMLVQIIDRVAADVMRAIAVHPGGGLAVQALSKVMSDLPEVAKSIGLQLSANDRQTLALARHKLNTYTKKITSTPQTSIVQPAPTHRLAYGYLAFAAAVFLLTLILRV